MANKIIALNDKDDNILYPITKFNAVKDSNGRSLPSDFSIFSEMEECLSANDVSNPNMLFNGNFKFNSSYVDAYGDSTDTTTQSPDVLETAIGWFFERDYNGTFTVSTKTLQVGSAGSFAKLYGNTNLQANSYEGKKFNLTVNVTGDGTNAFYYGIGYGDATINNSYTSIAEESTSGSGEFNISATIPTSIASSNIIKIRLYKNAGNAVINWVKLEIGENSTTYLPVDTGEKVCLIYDMRSTDANINRGWASGASCGKTIRVDFSVFNSIRIFASINGCEVQKVIKVANRKKSDFSINAINSTFSEVNYLRFTFPVANNAIQIGQYGIYTFDLNENTFSVRKGSSNADFFVYRLEGIY